MILTLPSTGATIRFRPPHPPPHPFQGRFRRGGQRERIFCNRDIFEGVRICSKDDTNSQIPPEAMFCEVTRILKTRQRAVETEEEVTTPCLKLIALHLEISDEETTISGCTRLSLCLWTMWKMATCSPLLFRSNTQQVGHFQIFHAAKQIKSNRQNPSIQI